MNIQTIKTDLVSYHEIIENSLSSMKNSTHSEERLTERKRQQS